MNTVLGSMRNPIKPRMRLFYIADVTTLAFVLSLLVTGNTWAQEITSPEACEAEAQKVETHLLKTQLSNDDLVKFADAIDKVRADCASGNLTRAGEDLISISTKITKSSTAS
jgi:hypothetical protein